MMPRSKVSARYQLTIPRAVREKFEIRPGEVVIVDVLSPDEILISRSSRIEARLKTLIGSRISRKKIPVDVLEERIESR